jgi:diadenylate cyclase
MWDLIHAFRLRDALDIGIVAFVIYRIFHMFKGTLAVQMLVGVGLLVGASVVSRKGELYTVNWILGNFWSFWVLAVVILFQPELRRALAQVGHTGFLRNLFAVGSAERSHVVDEVVRGVESLASRRIGALIVLERGTGLRHYAELGVAIDARLTADLLATIFLPYSPLHDGAVFIQDGRIAAAGCFLPLSRNAGLDRTLGTRHRAALGITEETDAVAITVSEETGSVSLAVAGRMEYGLDLTTLGRRLEESLATETLRPSRFPVLEGLLRRFAIREKA